MKNCLLICLLFCGTLATAQSYRTVKILANSKTLVKAIFETRDSAVLESLFAPDMQHFAYGGKIETREEAIRNIANNKSVFVQADMTVGGYGVAPAKDTTIVRYFFKGRENKPDGTSLPYTVNLVMVWVKMKKDIKLTRLETIRVN